MGTNSKDRPKSYYMLLFGVAAHDFLRLRLPDATLYLRSGSVNPGFQRSWWIKTGVITLTVSESQRLVSGVIVLTVFGGYQSRVPFNPPLGG